MKKEMIVFDKDGTLMDFDAFWVGVTVSVIQDILQKIHCEEVEIETVMRALGTENGVSDIDGLLCSGTYEEAGLALYEIVKEQGCTFSDKEIVEMLISTYKEKAVDGIVRPTCNGLQNIISGLKNNGYKLVVATADNPEMTEKCLADLGVREYFDAVFTDDGITPAKPDPGCILEYCQSVGVSIDKVVMVGDTMTDVAFARNAGMNLIGVCATEKNRQRLAPYTDAVIREVSQVLEVMEKLGWTK